MPSLTPPRHIPTLRILAIAARVRNDRNPPKGKVAMPPTKRYGAPAASRRTSVAGLSSRSPT